MALLMVHPGNSTCSLEVRSHTLVSNVLNEREAKGDAKTHGWIQDFAKGWMKVVTRASLPHSQLLSTPIHLDRQTMLQDQHLGIFKVPKSESSSTPDLSTSPLSLHAQQHIPSSLISPHLPPATAAVSS